MTILDLQDGLEAWFSFDTFDTDSQRNRLLDRSGHGRHGDLSGGVTTAVESPIGEAFSFDGSDDEAAATSVDVTDRTIAALLKVDTSAIGGTGREIFGDSNNGGWFVKPDSNVFALPETGGNNYLFDGNGYGNFADDTWHFVVTTTESNGAARYIVDGEVLELAPNQGSLDIEVPLRIGRGANGFSAFDIAFFGAWSRVLSDAERDHIRRLTNRRVSRL